MEYMIDFDVEGFQELQHHGTKGQKWGIRRYQNADGSLTPAGRKRYGDAPDFIKKKQLSRKERKQRAKNLEKARQAKAEKKEQEKTIAEKREELLKSTDAKKLYENKDLLTDAEINARINRIDLENKLKSKAAEQSTRKGMDKVNDMMKATSETVGNATAMYKKLDEAYSAVTSSAIGKVLSKKLGLEPPRKEVDMRDFYSNISKKTDKEIADMAKRAENSEKIKKYLGVT